MLGRKVMQLPVSRYNAGRHTVQFDASSLGSGVYLYQISTSNHHAAGKFTLIK
jgi:hypothetical protein